MEQSGGGPRWRQRLRDDPSTRPWYRFGVALAGGALMLAAALTGWLPGPGGIPLFLAGLALLATEFAWARRLLHRSREAFDWLQRRPAWLRRGAVCLALALALGSWWLVAAHQGLPGWLPDRVAGWADRLPGVERD